jgi:hypothetical protein
LREREGWVGVKRFIAFILVRFYKIGQKSCFGSDSLEISFKNLGTSKNCELRKRASYLHIIGQFSLKEEMVSNP